MLLYTIGSRQFVPSSCTPHLVQSPNSHIGRFRNPLGGHKIQWLLCSGSKVFPSGWKQQPWAARPPGAKLRLSRKKVRSDCVVILSSRFSYASGCFRSTPRLPSVLRIGGIVFEFGDNIKSIDLSVSIVACQQPQQYCGICNVCFYLALII